MEIEKTNIILTPDPKKVLLRAFEPATENQLINIIARIIKLSEDEVLKEIEKINKEFKSRHRNITEFLFKEISPGI